MSAGGDLAAVVALARELADGAPCSAAVRAALEQVLASRRGPSGPPLPSFGELVVRREGLPDWWGADNLLLAGRETRPNLSNGLMSGPRAGNLAVLGAGAHVGWMAFPGTAGLIAVGEGVQGPLTNLAATNGGTVMIGEGGTVTGFARVDARNGGAVLIGADTMWAGGVNILTDDMHAIREMETGRRINGYGGRVVIGPHVWLGEEARLVAGADVGEGSVVGLRAFVRGPLPPGSVSVGSPAAPIRRGVVWTREDLA